MFNPNLISTTTLNHAVAIKLGSILAPAVLLSFVGGMLLWRALHPNNQAALEEKFEKLRDENKELHNKFQKLTVNLAPPPPPLPLSPTPLIFASKTSTSPSKLTMLKKVLEENIQLRSLA